MASIAGQSLKVPTLQESTGRPSNSAVSLLKPMRRLDPPATMTAQTLPFFLVTRGLAKLLEDLRIDRFAVGAAGRFDHDDLHDRAHLGLARGADLGDGLADKAG